jgi:hypothetical protein
MNYTLVAGVFKTDFLFGRSQRPRGLRRGSAAARLLRLWVRITPGAWMSLLWVDGQLIWR